MKALQRQLKQLNRVKLKSCKNIRSIRNPNLSQVHVWINMGKWVIAYIVTLAQTPYRTNSISIRDEHILEQAELELSGLASNLIEYAEPPYDLKYLKSIHAQLFGDLYDWAGKLRQIDISKGDTRFCNFSRIEIETNKLLKPLQEKILSRLSTTITNSSTYRLVL